VAQNNEVKEILCVIDFNKVINHKDIRIFAIELNDVSNQIFNGKYREVIENDFNFKGKKYFSIS
jgi:hypothetical protein